MLLRHLRQLCEEREELRVVLLGFRVVALQQLDAAVVEEEVTVDVRAHHLDIEFLCVGLGLLEGFERLLVLAAQEMHAALHLCEHELHHVRFFGAVVFAVFVKRLETGGGIGHAAIQVVRAQAMGCPGRIGGDVEFIEADGLVEQCGTLLGRCRIGLLQHHVGLVGGLILMNGLRDLRFLLRRLRELQLFLQQGGLLLQALVAARELLVGRDTRGLRGHMAQALQVAVIDDGPDGGFHGDGKRVTMRECRIGWCTVEAQEGGRHGRDRILCQHEIPHGRGARHVDTHLFGGVALRILEGAFPCDEQGLGLAHRVFACRGDGMRLRARCDGQERDQHAAYERAGQGEKTSD